MQFSGNKDPVLNDGEKGTNGLEQSATTRRAAEIHGGYTACIIRENCFASCIGILPMQLRNIVT
jgi:hypothetical protein